VRTPIKLVAVMSAVSVAAGGGLSIATAKTHHRAQTNQSSAQKPPRGGGAPFMKAAADYLGLDQKALCDQLHGGKTLAQVAEAQGKSVDGLKQAIVADAKSHLDQAVADGKITADQEQSRLDDLNSHLDDIVNKTPPKGGRGHRPPPPMDGGQQGAGQQQGSDGDGT